jgi:uncharacterized phage-like protein YoqJ
VIIAATGHRPDKLGGYHPEVDRRAYDFAFGYLEKAKPEGVVSGMALGWDMAVADAAIDLGIPLIAAIPFVGQERKWKPAARKRYERICTLAHEAVVVTPYLLTTQAGSIAKAFMNRNEWMVDRCTKLVALWDGGKGGTANCIAYAVSRGKSYDNLWDKWSRR